MSVIGGNSEVSALRSSSHFGSTRSKGPYRSVFDKVRKDKSPVLGRFRFRARAGAIVAFRFRSQ
jgi:hypothetical protein